MPLDLNMPVISWYSKMKYLIAGPCAIESEEQINSIAKEVKKSGANILRGGAFKPRTSPYTFQGLGEEGLKYLANAAKANGLKSVSEITDISQLDLFKDIDILQVGSRNMQNFELLKALGWQDKPVILKRGFGSTISEWLFAAEYIISGGNKNVILCERGIRTFEDSTRFTLDISAIPVVKSKSNLEIIVDPCHAAGTFEYVIPLSKAAMAVGADGLMIEVHPDPDHALSDGAQSLTPANFEKLTKEVL